MKADEPAIFLALGIALQLQARWAEAVEAFRRAIDIDPDCELAYNSLALTQKKAGALEKALHNYDAGAKALVRRLVKAKSITVLRKMKHADNKRHIISGR